MTLSSDRQASIVRWLRRTFNQVGGRKQCYVCDKKFRSFRKYEKGSKGISEFRKKLQIVGSDLDNFSCMYCGSHDRERHLFMYFDNLKFWGQINEARILHFAPEMHLSRKIEENLPKEYVQADLYPKNDRIRAIDATRIPWPSQAFDLVIANHVLEHIPEYLKALGEFYRVLRPGGLAILQTPYSRFLKNNFEDESINTDKSRLFFHGQIDHVRTFGEHQFFADIERIGFELRLTPHSGLFDGESAERYGVNPDEQLILVAKPILESQTV